MLTSVTPFSTRFASHALRALFELPSLSIRIRAKSSAASFVFKYSICILPFCTSLIDLAALLRLSCFSSISTSNLEIVFLSSSALDTNPSASDFNCASSSSPIVADSNFSSIEAFLNLISDNSSACFCRSSINSTSVFIFFSFFKSLQVYS
ncbi:Uncharacterised protein [Streptococcus pneumoniae]|nr:Uncharacterised protein [Streptococcus pneumoniae]